MTASAIIDATMSCPEIRYVVVCWRYPSGQHGEGAALPAEVAAAMAAEYARRWPDRIYSTRPATALEIAFVKG